MILNIIIGEEEMSLSGIIFRKNPLFLSGLLLSAALALGGCGSAKDVAGEVAAAETSAASHTAETANAGPRTMTDAQGHEVIIPAQPGRIVAPFLEDPLIALGMKPVAQWSAGGHTQNYLQNELQGVPALNMTGGLKPEEALGYAPDLIILPDASYLKGSAYEDFAKIAPTFVLSANGSEWREAVTRLGEILGKPREAEAALQKHDRKIAAAKERLGVAVGEKTAILLQGNGEKGFKLFGPRFYGGAMLYQELGFKQPKALKGEYESYSLESLAELGDVDYIFVISGPGRAKPPEDNGLWKNLPAVKQGRVFEADSGHWFNRNVLADGFIVDDVLRYVTK